MASLTATPDPATGSVLLDVEQSLVRDIFSRVVANGWGNATTGQLWTTQGGAVGDYSVNGTQGVHTNNTVGAGRFSFTSVGMTDMGAMVQVTVPVAALTQPFELFTLVRFTDTINYYAAMIQIAPSGVVTLFARKVRLGVITNLGSVVLGQVHVPGATWLMAAEVCGTTLKVKAWRSTVTEPGWMLEVTDFDVVTGSNTGVRSVLSSGNTNGTVAFAYDNFVSWISQPIKIFRVTPNNVRTEVRGSPLNTTNPTAAAATAIATLWDNEAPLDTVIYYVLTSNCGSTAVLTSSSVTLDGQGGGWLRDPMTPANNIRIAFSDTQFNDCDETMRVELLDWEPRVYRTASGIFDIVNAQRPSTVSMRRKRYESSMTFASKTLDDIDAIEEIIAPGTILLLSLPAGYGFGRPYGTDFITIADVAQDPVDTDNYLTPFRSWEIPFALSPAPADLDTGGTGSNGIGGGGATYADMTASAIGTTYATTTATGLTYQQLAQGVGY